MAKKLGRNERCWCGSGLKYKRCHLNRDKQTRAQPWEVEDALRDAFSAKYCSVPESWKKACVGHPIRAHTVPKRGSLAKIARDGHVYAFVPTFQKLTEHKGRVPPELLGINRASTFTGFCSKHDTELFAPLETQPFRANKHQCYLLSYRAFAREVYTKTASSALADVRRGLDKGRSKHEQFAIQSASFMMDVGTAAGLRDNERHLKEFEQLLVDGDFDGVRAYVVELEAPPDVMCSAGIFPESTFDGALLQDIGDVGCEAQLLTLTSFADEDKGYVVLSWLPGSDAICHEFVASLSRLEDSVLTDALVRMMFEYCENVFLRPSWWEALPEASKRSLVLRMSGIFDQFVGNRESGDLKDDGLRLPRWSVRNRAQV